MEESDKTNTHGSTTSSQPSMQISPDPIFQMVTGFCISKTLMTAVELEVFTKLSGNKTIDIKEFQNIFGIQQRPAEVFATALVSLGLLNVNLTKNKDTKQEGNVENKDYGDKDKENRYYSNSQLSEVFLNRNRPSYIGDFIIMTDRHQYHRWGKLRESLKTNKPVEAVAEDEISAGTMFDKAKSNQLTYANVYTCNVWY
jgi:hypothetical protein